jgi:hypothetical protein
MKITDALNAEIMNVLLGVSAGLIILWLVTDIMLKTFMHENEVKCHPLARVTTGLAAFSGIVTVIYGLYYITTKFVVLWAMTL